MDSIGNRLHKLRKEAGLTQQKLAKKIASVFGVSIDYLVNGDKDQKAKEALGDNELLKQFKAINNLPKDKQTIIKDLIEAYLFRTTIQQQLAH